MRLHAAPDRHDGTDDRCVLRLISAMRPAPQGGGPSAPLGRLAFSQLLGWGSLYYPITLLAQPMADDTGWSREAIFGGFSLALMVAALSAPTVGDLLHHHGGRRVMSLGSLVAAAALTLLAWSSHPLGWYGGWILVGWAMAATLYEAAFSTLRMWEGIDFRRGVAWIAIVGGLASTLFWPLVHLLETAWGWRAAWGVMAGIQLCLLLPIHLTLPEHRPASPPPHAAAAPPPPSRHHTTLIWLATSFAAGSWVTATISAHGAWLLAERGVMQPWLLLALTLFGPMQVLGRTLELLAGHRLSVARLGLITMALLIAAMLLLPGVGLHPIMVMLFALLYGLANGMMTTVRGAVPAALLPDGHYAAILGRLSAPGTLSRALSPVLMAILYAVGGGDWVMLALQLIAMLALISFWVALRSTQP